ncbi:MAG: pyridoxamine 5'-phosphate oxidase family protein, partial [Desulfomonilaceae bacterium]
KEEIQLRNELRNLFSSQRFGALATLEPTHPYLNLVAFAATHDLKNILFATTRTTRKYSNIATQSGVAMLVDNRSNEASDLRRAIAVTVIGTAIELEENEKTDSERIYLVKHPQMKEFLASPTTALIKLNVDYYYLVTRFQNIAILDLKS